MAVREQVGVVRALADQVECLGLWGANEGLRAQLVEELTRLGCRILEAAAELSGAIPPAPESGVPTRFSDDDRAASS